MSSERVAQLAGHLTASPTTATGTSQSQTFGKIGSKNASDVVIVSALRTAICKAKKGAFKDTTPDDLLKAVLEQTLLRTKVPTSILGDVVVGNVQTVGAYVLPARAAEIRAGFPDTVPLRTVNRQCSSGLQAIASVASEIAAGYIDAGVGAGVESMTLGGNPGDPSTLPPMNMSAIFDNALAAQCLTAMGMTSENVAEKYGVSREKQDALAVSSHAKALKAIKEGKFRDEIVPVEVTVLDADGNEKKVTVSQDEGPREGTTMEVLGKMKSAFKPGGSTTAGNASQVSDGAAAVLLMRRSEAARLGLPVLGVFRGFKVVGCDPSVMGIGPAEAIPALLKDVGMTVKDVDVFELNEAFASQAVYCMEKLGVPADKLNPLGGAIALGHPLGCTGARQTATLLHQLKRTGKKTGVVSMCIGTGMGAAAMFESQ
jgi:acetyl-CoA acyltransferase 1